MIIEADIKKTLGEIAVQFSAGYPFLKLEFYNQPHSIHAVSSEKNLLPPNLTGKETGLKFQPGTVEIHDYQKTGDVEQLFKKNLGLNVQIFRRHGEDWIQTVGTDDLTLREQNEIGQKASEEFLHGTNRWIEKEKFL